MYIFNDDKSSFSSIERLRDYNWNHYITEIMDM